MLVTAIKTPKITSGSTTLIALLDQAVSSLEEGSVLAVTSKIVSLCEGATVPMQGADKEVLMEQESDLFIPAALSKYGHHFTITNTTLIPMAGIDASNGGDDYVLWPRDAQRTANELRAYLARRFSLQRVGVIITDSTSRPMRRGSTGILLAHSGFAALRDYSADTDLFGRPFYVTQADIGGGLAAAAVLQMGEGAEQTPLAVLSDIAFVKFENRDPSAEELSEIYIPLEDDLFAPFLTAVAWQKGKRGSAQ